MTARVITLAISGILITSLSGCSDFRRAVGMEKSAPDEFQVVVRPPLSLPPGFTDKPEEILKKSEKRMVDSQSSTGALLGVADASGSSFERLFDFSNVPADIRVRVDEETYGIQIEKRLPLQKLFGGIVDVGPVLDKMAEDARLRKAVGEGQAATAEGTKAIDPADGLPLTIK
jgi:hypothetical protein